MSKYKIIYDYDDEDGGKHTFEDEADTWEEAQQIRRDLIASPDYSNVEIIGLDFE